MHHVFFLCQVAIDVWRFVAMLCGLTCHVFSSIKEWLSWIDGCNLAKT